MGEMNVPLPLLASLLFSMMGPIGLLPLFAKSTAGADARLQKTIAVRAAIFATLALAVAVFVGSAIMQSAGTSRSSLIIASGVILTLTALRNIFGSGSPQSSTAQPASEALALAPIAIPGIVTPMGVAILILFASYFPEMVDRLAILAVMCGIMLANLLAMFSAQWFMRAVGPTPLIVLGAIFGVLQAAMGVEMIVSGLGMSRLFGHP